VKPIELSLRKCVFPEFIFGLGARKLAGSYARNLGIRRPLLVTNPKVRQTPWFLDVTQALDATSAEYFIFDEVVPNPRDFNVSNRPLPPLICIPTTAGTSADVSQFAIIVDTARKVKMAIVSKSIVPDLALIDPETTHSVDFTQSFHPFHNYVST